LKACVLALFVLSCLSRIVWAEIETEVIPGHDHVVSDDGSYSVIGATKDQELALRRALEAMRPEVLPVRIVFVPHWKYLDDTRTLRLNVPTGYMSQMFTHLPTRTVYIDTARYQGEEWLRYWMAHELGHLASGSIREEDAEKIASKLRKRLKR